MVEHYKQSTIALHAVFQTFPFYILSGLRLKLKTRSKIEFWGIAQETFHT